MSDSPSRQRENQHAIRGRGAASNRDSRYSPLTIERDAGEAGGAPKTECLPERARTIIARNSSPDIPFIQSINPYRGCEHGCIYCYARPTHAYLDLSPGLDFETRLRVKYNAAEQLERELANPRYQTQTITLGANTDPYQPVEREHRITRALLEVLLAHRHPVSIITKSGLIERDIDLLAELASQGLASVAISVTTLDRELKRRLEPRATSGSVRLAAVRALSAAGVPVSVLCAPVIPTLNDAELEQIVAQSADAGATGAAYILLRLPGEVSILFQQWLELHYPDRAAHVMSLIRQCRGGADNDVRFGHRMRGQGPIADLIAQRFKLACKRHGLDQLRRHDLRTDLFRVPPRAGDQLGLFSADP